MQVADFLQDEATCQKAASLANTQLLQGKPVASNPSHWPKPLEFDLAALQRLQPELAQKILKQEGCFAYWKHVLPSCCHSMALAAALSESGELPRVGLKDEETLKAVHALAPVLRKFNVATEETFALRPLVHLESLHVSGPGLGYPKLPSSLQALTHLSIYAHDVFRKDNDLDESGFSAGSEESEGSGEDAESEEVEGSGVDEDEASGHVSTDENKDGASSKGMYSLYLTSTFKTEMRL